MTPRSISHRQGLSWHCIGQGSWGGRQHLVSDDPGPRKQRPDNLFSILYRELMKRVYLQPRRIIGLDRHRDEDQETAQSP